MVEEREHVCETLQHVSLPPVAVVVLGSAVSVRRLSSETSQPEHMGYSLPNRNAYSFVPYCSSKRSRTGRPSGEATVELPPQLTV